ncbi:MAG: hypothetical protein KDG89_08720 [Geminicoccaceae bacterium]|nr:hypothetical protein [Geminicoccaceae bacterium]
MSLFRSLAAKAINAFQDVRDVSPDAAGDIPDGTVVRVAGEVRAGGAVRDPLFGVEAAVPLLVREVEMRQYREILRGARRDQDFVYDLEWSARDLNRRMTAMGRTRYRNPPFAYRTERFPSPDARLGRWRLDPAVARHLPATLPVEEEGVLEYRLPDRVFHRQDGWLVEGGHHGALRVRHLAGPKGPVTVTAVVQGDRLVPQEVLGKKLVDVDDA